MVLKSSEGEIVQVEGGHIVRSTGRKDRHSKVYTSKGPRDRRVRLSAHTAIQFYDVQDRLGYDRPSKAVDWLIKKAKSAIDNLAELPPWNPPPLNNTNEEPEHEPDDAEPEIPMQEQSESSGYNFQIQRQQQQLVGGDSSSFMTPTLDTETLADTIKSFFPTSASTPSINFQHYPPDDLGLSLHSFNHPNSTNNHPHTLYDHDSSFDPNYHRMVSWNNETRGAGAGGGFVFNTPSQQSLAFRGGPLQSTLPHSLRAWDDVSDGLHHGFCLPAQEDHSNRPSSSSTTSHH